LPDGKITVTHPPAADASRTLWTFQKNGRRKHAARLFLPGNAAIVLSGLALRLAFRGGRRAGRSLVLCQDLPSFGSAALTIISSRIPERI
jgi:hypothetical protein